jgi:hypothetical protein
MRIRRFALCWKGNPSFNRVEQILPNNGASVASVLLRYCNNSDIYGGSTCGIAQQMNAASYEQVLEVDKPNPPPAHTAVGGYVWLQIEPNSGIFIQEIWAIWPSLSAANATPPVSEPPQVGERRSLDYITRLETQIKSEGRDEAWAAQKEEQLKASVPSDQKLSITSVDCRSSRCEIKVTNEHQQSEKDMVLHSNFLGDGWLEVIHNAPLRSHLRGPKPVFREKPLSSS